MDKRLLTSVVSFLCLLSFAQVNRRAAWFQPVPVPPGNGGALYNDLILNDLANVSTAASQSSYATPACQPAPNALVLVTIINTKASAPDIPTFSGNGLTWVQIGTSNFNTLANPTQRITMFRAQGASPALGPGIADFGGATQSGCIIQIVEFQGADASAANGANALVQTNLNGRDATANPSVAYTSPALPKTNALFWAWGGSVNSSSDATPQASWVILRQLAYGAPDTGAAFNYQMNALPATSATDSATRRNWAGMMVEVKPGLDPSQSTRPTLVQHLATYTTEQSGNYFTNNLPNPTLPGNFLAVHVVFNYQASPPRTVTITDDKGNNYTRASSVSDQAALVYEDWYATNIIAGTTRLSFVFNSDPPNAFHTEIGEFAHVASYNPVDAAANNYLQGNVVDSGSMTTTSDGDLILSYFSDVSNGCLGPVNEPTNFLGGGGKWLATQTSLGTAAQFAVQSKAGQLAYLAAFGGPPAEFWQTTAVAYKRGPGGTLPSSTSIRIVRLQWDDDWSSTPSQSFLPFEGNLMVMTSTYVKSLGLISGLTANPAGDWTAIVTINEDAPQMFFATNQAPQNNPPIVLNMSYAGYQSLLCFWDIANANPTPYDMQSENHVAYAEPNAAITNNAAITPTTSHGLIINIAQFWTGPESCSLDPSQILDAPFYVGATDSSHYSQGDTTQHYFNPDTSTVAFGQQLANDSSTGSDGLAVAFKRK